MNIAIRADASVHIGAGHVMRCLALADELRRQGAHIVFLCGELEGHMAATVEAWHFKVILLPMVAWQEDAQHTIAALAVQTDWLIVDHYGLDQRWQQILRAHTQNLMVIDDLVNRALLCDVLLNQNTGVCAAQYQAYIPAHCQLLLGAQFALIRPEFRRSRSKALKKRQEYQTLQRILVSIGGMDVDNMTAAVLAALAQVPWQLPPVVDVVLNAQSAHLANVRAQARQHPLLTQVHTSANMAELMLQADLAVGAAGSTAWERCCLGLPTVAIQVADNQAVVIEPLARLGAHLAITTVSDDIVHDIAEKVTALMQSPERMHQLSTVAASICHGLGAVWVGLAIDPVLARDGEKIELIDATLAHAEMILAWQRYPETRQYANNPSVPNRAEHVEWMRAKISSPMGYFWVIQHGGEAAGILRLDQRPDSLGYVLSIFVIPAKYRLGIAFAVLQVVKRLHLGVDIYAQVMVDNQASVGLFKRAEFIQIQPDLFVWRD